MQTAHKKNIAKQCKLYLHAKNKPGVPKQQ